MGKKPQSSHWKAKWLANKNLFGDAKSEAEARRDWLENRNLSSSEIKAKYGVDHKALWYLFGPRPFPSPDPRKWEIDAKLKAAIEADWFGNPAMTNEDVAAKYGISSGKLQYHFGKRGLPVGRPKKGVTLGERQQKQDEERGRFAWSPEDIDL